jgi:hypothetical protein
LTTGLFLGQPSAATRLKKVRVSPLSFILELWEFMRERKKFWLLPLLVLMLVFGGLVVLTKGTAIAPFIYTIF